ncbi:hypothetical protein BDN70DRAFT_878452 [Pholiota conissans]|uniref:Uncharacterized protein n=1 Tax=Pholiota conissans TaxID=109636 RepID=A0A9P5Z1K7_9AGAR|nr:hypothetical protein BDN70DRAFT_878452 [Pholiota conissans]
MSEAAAGLDRSKFTLDVSGIAGVLGGEESFAAMSSVHLMRGRRWLGLYNSPGSYYVAKKYGTLAQFPLWKGLFPGPPVEPAAMLELDSKSGPRYMGVESGTRLPTTGHLAYLLARYCDRKVQPIERPVPEPAPMPTIVAPAPTLPGLRTSYPPVSPSSPYPTSPSPTSTTNFLLRNRSPKRSSTVGTITSAKPPPKVIVTIVKLGNFKEWPNYPIVPEEFFSQFNAWGFVPTIATISFAIGAAIARDWFSFAMIFLGALCNGVSCYIIGSGELRIHCRKPSPSSPPGDGILVNDGHIIILQGDEHMVSHVIRGRYHLHYNSSPQYMDIGFCSFLLTAQFIVQLFLVPQGMLFGQIMFLATFVVSWGFNAYLASVDRDTLQTNVLLQALGNPEFMKLDFDKWYAAAAFVACYLHPDTLEELVPNKTPAWNICRSLTLKAIAEDRNPTNLLLEKEGQIALNGLSKPSEREFVEEFIERAAQAYNGAKVIKNRNVIPTPAHWHSK